MTIRHLVRPHHDPADHGGHRARIARRLTDIERRIAELRRAIDLLQTERARLRLQLNHTWPQSA